MAHLKYLIIESKIVFSAGKDECQKNTTQNLLRITFSIMRYFCVFVKNVKID
jgi:hypothetical protein